MRTAVDPASPSVIGSRRMGGGVAAREVSILAGIGSFTKFQRRFRYLGSQLVRMIEPVTMSPMEVNVFESHFVAVLPSRLANCDTECNRMIHPVST